MAYIANDGRSYESQAAADAANKRMAATGATPVSTKATSNPIANVNGAQTQLNSGVNAGGQALSAVQKANLEKQNAQLNGTMTQVQAAQAREQATADALKKSTTINNYTSQDPNQIAAQQKINQQYNLDPMTGFKGQAINMQAGQTMARDFAREQAMAKKLGGLPETPEETAKMLQATYSPDELQKLGLSNYIQKALSPASTGGAGISLPSGVPGVGAQAGAGQYLSAQQLSDMGLTSDKLKSLVAAGNITQQQADQISKTGLEMDKAQQLLNSTPKPTNATIGVLEAALKAKSGVGNQPLGESDLFKQAGLNGYAVLAQNLAQHSREMDQKYQSYANLVGETSGAMADVWQKALDGYKAAQDSFNKQAELLTKAKEKADDYQQSLELMNKQNQLQKDTWKWQQDYQAKLAKNSPDFQFISETENQPAGYFNKNTGEFTPLSVGGDAYGPVNKSSYLGSASSSNGASLFYDNPVAHGTANANVVASNPNLIDIYENGFKKAAGPNGYGGQCFYELEKWVSLNGKDFAVGNTAKDKAATLSKMVKQGNAFYKGQGQPQVGYTVMSNDDPKYWHGWVINAITDDGKLVASEFNRAGSRVFSNNRIVDPNDKSIIGFIKTEPKSQYQVEKETGAQKNIQKAAEGIKNIMTGKKQGGFLDLLQAGTGIAKDILVDQGKKSQARQADALIKAQTQEGIKAGVLDQNGQPFSPDRMAVRSGAFTDTMLNQKYTDLKKAVQKGYEPPEALQAFQQDMIYAQDKKKKLDADSKLQEKYSQPMNENQGKAIGFAVSAQQAEGFLPKNGTDASLAKLNDWTRNFRNDDVVSDKLNEIKDPVAKQIAQAEMQWIANVLRGESGASIAASEYKNAGQTYFPRPGDTAQMLQVKKQARDQKVQNLLIQGGPQGAKYWENLGYEIPSAIAKQYGMSVDSKDDSLGLFSGGTSGRDSLGLGI